MIDRESNVAVEVPAGPRPGAMLPYFKLPSAQGKMIDPVQYKQRRNLLLVFVHDQACDACRNVLRAFAQHYDYYKEEEAEVLAIAAVSQEEARRMVDDLALPFPVLADEDGAVHRLYGAVASEATPGAAVYLADRFGEIRERWLAGKTEHTLPAQEDVLEYLRFIGYQCPECGAPEWPPV
ncbi:MAG: redoxin domain-containing protein [Dehalococcoidales bacterium]|nr:redoxin domain-containing protein [Dehalococcoidales bacterium]